MLTIGTGGPDGVYFQTGNAICKIMHKFAISAEHGRKKGTNRFYRCNAPSTGGSNYNIGQIKEGEFQFGVAQSLAISRSEWFNHFGKDKQFKGLTLCFFSVPRTFQILIMKKAKTDMSEKPY